MAFRPKLIPTLITIPCLIILFSLSAWQAYRMTWKQELIDNLQARSSGPAIALEDRPYAEDEDEFQLVELEGVFYHGTEFHMMNRSLNGNPGVNVFTPFQRLDTGSWVLVNRGWAPLDRKDPAARAEGQITGPQKITGLLRFPKGQGWFIPDNQIDKNLWFFVDMDAMRATMNQDLPDYYIMSGDNNVPGGFPIGSQWRLDLPNNHFQYAITWFLLGITLMVIYVVYHRRDPEADDGSEHP